MATIGVTVLPNYNQRAQYYGARVNARGTGYVVGVLFRQQPRTKTVLIL
jgi:hypothetical protein